MRRDFLTRIGCLSAEVTGKGHPLLLLHANPGDSHDYEAVVPALAKEFQVHALDWPGYGLSLASQPDNLSAMAFADLLEDVVGSLGSEPVGIIGNSVGGFAAARFAMRYPEKVAALVLVNSSGFTRHTLISRLFCRIMGLPWFNTLVDPWLAEYYLRVRTPAVKAMLNRAVARKLDTHFGRISSAVWRSFLSTEHDLRGIASGIVTPTMLAWGRHDFLLPLVTDGRTAESCIPQSELIVFDTGHAPFAEAPESFLAVAMPFLRMHIGA